MTRVTKELASSVARQMVSKRNKQLDDYELETSQVLKKYLESLLPTDVLKIAETPNEKYLKKQCNFLLIGQGLNHDEINIKSGVYYIESKGFNSVTIELPKKEALAISKRLEHSRSEYREINNLRKEIEVTLISLKTAKRTQESFPEAFEFFPKESNTTYLPVNLNNLRSKLK